MAATDTSSGGDPPIRIGVSACLLGREVRFDGGHKRNDLLVGIFGRFAEFVPVCPEVEAGLGVPREPMHLVRRGGAVRLVGNVTRADHSDAMRRYSNRRIAALAHENLSGYVLKAGSPSCGVERVRYQTPNGRPARDGRGVYAGALMRRFPNLPVVQEDHLDDARLRDNFIERVFAYRRIRSFFAARWTRAGLVRLHTAHQLQLIAHSPRGYAALSRMVTNGPTIPRSELRDRYEAGFMDALGKIATIARHVIVLRHIAGCLRDRLDADARRELDALIEDYRRGRVPLTVAISLARHHVRTLDVTSLKNQVYLDPHPRELRLRNRA